MLSRIRNQIETGCCPSWLVDANSGHTVLHEYGHAVMHNVYGSMPTNDCLKPHHVSRNSGVNCAWIEGWADFFSIYVKYDPVITWGCTQPCTPESINLEETHTNPIEIWDDGDKVEGNVAASLWDFIDPYTDGLDKTNSAITPFWKIWDIVWNTNHDTFSQFWTSWYTNVTYTNSVATLYQNTIDYGWTHCQDYTTEPDDSPLDPRNIANPADPAYRRVLCTDGDIDYFRFNVVAGRTYTIETMDLGTAVDGSIGDTTLTLYSMGQFGGLTQLAFDDNSGSQYLTSKIVQTAATDGVYVAGVRHATGRGHFAYGYGIDFTATSPNAAPAVTAPATSIQNNQTLGSLSAGVFDVQLQDKWTRSDPDGIASQDLERCLNADCIFTDVAPQPAANATSANYRLPVGTVMQSQIRAIDSLGADSGYKTGAKVVVRGFQESDAAFTYSGSWTNQSSAAFFGGAVKTTSGAAGTKASFLFYGQSVALVATKVPLRAPVSMITCIWSGSSQWIAA